MSESIKELSVFGLSHKTAPLQVREQFALDAEATEGLYRRLLAKEDIKEALILSTCNRVELYAVTDLAEKTQSLLRDALMTHVGGHIARDDHYYWLTGVPAMEHLFRVTSGLDSMILGESQIAAQVKESYALAVKCGATRRLLNYLASRAFNISKKVRTDTEIQKQPVSVPYAAVILAEQIFGDLSERNVLLIGAGDMSEIAARHLLERNIHSLSVANRSPERAEKLAQEFSGNVVSMDKVDECFLEADIVISSTSSKDAVVTAEQVRQAMKQRKHRPMFFIDIGVPRDVDPEVNKINNVYLFDVDDLQQVVDDNLEERQLSAEQAEEIIRKEVALFTNELTVRDLSPLIADLIAQVESVRDAEMEKLYKRCPELSVATREAIHQSTTGLMKKVLHPALEWLKESGAEEAPHERARIIKRLFGLNGHRR